MDKWSPDTRYADSAKQTLQAVKSQKQRMRSYKILSSMVETREILDRGHMTETREAFPLQR